MAGRTVAALAAGVLLAACRGTVGDSGADAQPSSATTRSPASASVTATAASPWTPAPSPSSPPTPAAPTPPPSVPASRAPAATPSPAVTAALVSVSVIDSGLAARMRSSWRAGCPVPLSQLRYLRLRFYGFDGRIRVGELVVHQDAVRAVGAAFQELFHQRFPLRQMRLIDDFDGDDDASVAADNTSAFNCRPVAGSTRWSQHSYGRAVDVNPFENPYVSGSAVSPPAAAAYAARVPLRRGMLGGEAVTAFTAQGWGWGGNWRSVKDYQHFSSNGR